MAYMSQEKKKSLAPAIKSVLKEYGMKGSIGVNNHSTLVVNLSQGPIDFGSTHDNVNQHWIASHYSGVAEKFLTKLAGAMMNGNFDHSDIQSDYFHVGWYIDINIGKWNKPYQVTS